MSIQIPITKGTSPIKTYKRWEPERSALVDAFADARETRWGRGKKRRPRKRRR